jgi:hypothetical protein
MFFCFLYEDEMKNAVIRPFFVFSGNNCNGRQDYFRIFIVNVTGLSVDITELLNKLANKLGKH